MLYNIQYFLSKARSIPDELWHMGSFTDIAGPSRCWLGHCHGEEGLNHSLLHTQMTEQIKESQAIMALGGKYKLHFAAINDNSDRACHYDYFESSLQFIGNPVLNTPKKRIVACLEWIAAQEGVYEDITKELAILPVSETTDLIIKPIQHV